MAKKGNDRTCRVCVGKPPENKNRTGILPGSTPGRCSRLGGCIVFDIKEVYFTTLNRTGFKQVIMKLTSWLRVVLSFLLLAFVGVLDYYIPHKANTAILYALPVFMFSYSNRVSLFYAILFAVNAAIVWGIVDRITDTDPGSDFIVYNIFSRCISFSIVAALINRFIVEKKLRQIISRQKEKQDESNEKLKITNDELNKFVGMAAHDIRNPVGAIQMTSEMLLEDPSVKGETKAFIGMIHEAAASSLLILNDTLNISQIQSGTVHLKITDTDFIVFIRDCIRTNEYLAFSKQQKILFEATIGSVMVSFDKSRILQVVNNLITNAIKYSGMNTTITVKVDYADGDHTFIRTEVIDQGLGIAKEFHATLFEPFARTDNRPTNNESETGLGLAIVKRIIDLHHGTIGFKSEKGIGSSFFITIPVSQERIVTKK
jgi:signal transduction histidine kinase